MPVLKDPGLEIPAGLSVNLLTDPLINLLVDHLVDLLNNCPVDLPVDLSCPYPLLTTLSQASPLGFFMQPGITSANTSSLT